MEGNIKNTLKKWLNKKIQDWKKTQEQQNWEDVQTTVKTIINCFTEDQLKDFSIYTKDGEIISLEEILLSKYEGKFPAFKHQLTKIEVNLTIKESLCKNDPIPITLKSFKRFFKSYGDPKTLVKREIWKRNFYKCIYVIVFLKKLISIT